MKLLRSLAKQVGDGFTSIKGSPRELWLVLLLDFLESFNYFSVSLLFTLYLSSEFGVSDFQAGTLYGLWGTLLVAWGILFAGVIDLLGVKRSLIACYIVNIVCRYTVAATHSKDVLLWVLLGPLAIAGALGTPVQTIAIKRYTSEEGRAFAFSLFYTFMNIAGLTCASVLDFFRVTLRHGFRIASLPADHLLNDGSRLLLLAGVFSSVLALGLSCCLRESAVVSGRLVSEEEGLGLAAAAEKGVRRGQGGPAGDPAGNAAATQPLLKEEAQGSTRVSDPGEGSGAAVEAPPAPGRPLLSRWRTAWSNLAEVMESRETWKFLAVCFILECGLESAQVNLRQIFRHLDATLPKYLIRMYGCDARVGFIYGINPLLIIFLVPVVGSVTARFAHFDVIHWGGYVSALSPLFMVITPRVWGAVLFVVFLSLGESIWSPRWYAFSMEMAPVGREGIFTALASAPLFAAKLPTGMLSGKLLEDFCPDTLPCVDGSPAGEGGTGTCDGRALWTVISLITLSSPLLLLLLQRWIRPVPQAAAGNQGLERGPSAGLRQRRSAVLGEPDTSLAVPAQDHLEDEAPADALLQARQGSRAQAAPRRA